MNVLQALALKAQGLSTAQVPSPSIASPRSSMCVKSADVDDVNCSPLRLLSLSTQALPPSRSPGIRGLWNGHGQF